MRVYFIHRLYSCLFWWKGKSDCTVMASVCVCLCVRCIRTFLHPFYSWIAEQPTCIFSSQLVPLSPSFCVCNDVECNVYAQGRSVCCFAVPNIILFVWFSFFSLLHFDCSRTYLFISFASSISYSSSSSSFQVTWGW